MQLLVYLILTSKICPETYAAPFSDSLTSEFHSRCKKKSKLRNKLLSNLKFPIWWCWIYMKTSEKWHFKAENCLFLSQKESIFVAFCHVLWFIKPLKAEKLQKMNVLSLNILCFYVVILKRLLLRLCQAFTVYCTILNPKKWQTIVFKSNHKDRRVFKKTPKEIIYKRSFLPRNSKWPGFFIFKRQLAS